MTATSLARLGLLFALIAGVSGCGGGGGGGDVPSVNNIIAASPRYGTSNLVTVSGRNLRAGSGIDLEIKGACVNPTRLTASSSDDTQQFRCDVRGTGEMKFAVYAVEQRNYLGELTIVVPTPQVEVTTTKGTFRIELDPAAAPLTVQNFLAYVNGAFYNNNIVTRVIAGRYFESGGYTRNYSRVTPGRSAIAIENTGLRNLKGTVAAGRSATTPNTVQEVWFVNLADNADLDRVDDGNPGYPVFGRVTTGIDVVEAIGAVETGIHQQTGTFDAPVAEILTTTVVQIR